MKALISRLDENCKEIHTAGNDPQYRRLTKSYRTMTTLYRYAIRPALRQWNGRLKAEIWNGDNIYKDPDRVMTWNSNIFN